MSKDNNHFPNESNEFENLLNYDDKSELPPPLTSSKCSRRCKRFRIISRIFGALITLAGIYYFTFNGFDFSSSFFSTQSNALFHPSKPQCNPTLDWYSSSESFDPKSVGGLGLFFKGSVSSPKVRFERKDQTNITIAYSIKASSEAAGKKSQLNARPTDNFYAWSIRGPASWHHRASECIAVDVTVTLPTSLDQFGKLIIFSKDTIGSEANINLDFHGELNLEKLRVGIPHGNIELNGQKVNYLDLETKSGDIRIGKVTSSEVDINTRHGKLVANKVSAASFKADGVDTSIEATLTNSHHAILHTLSGDVTLEVESFDPFETANAQFKAISLNGDASVKVPASFLGRFSSKTLNGSAKLIVDENEDNLHVKLNSTRTVYGYKGEVQKTPNSSEAVTVNGDSLLQFF